MKAERSSYLESAKIGNKVNGYRAVNGLGIGDSLSLQVPRYRLGQFKPWLLNVKVTLGWVISLLENATTDLYYFS